MSAPTRVLHLAAGNLFGGVERIVAECAASRTRCPSMVPLFAVCFDGRLAAEIERTGAACARLGDVRVSRPHTVLRARRALARLLEAEHVDAVVCHSSWMFGLAAPIVRACGAALTLWIHDCVSGRSWPERWARLTIPDLVIANSRFTAHTVPAMYANVPTSVLYAPVSPGTAAGEGDRAALRRELGADEQEVVVLIASRFEAWKGHRELIDATARLRRPWRLWVAGGPQRSAERTYERSLRQRAGELGVDGRVRFLGERSDVHALMRAADVHCQPNTAPEPFGLAFVEALYAGLPVVTTEMGGACEIVTNRCGVLVRPGVADELVDALDRLACDPAERQQLGAAGPARAYELCDPARQLAMLEIVIGKTLAERVRA